MGVGGNFVSRLSKTPSVLLINPLLRSSSHGTRIRSGWSGIASGTLRSNPRLQNQQLLAGPLDEHSNPPLPVSQKPGPTACLWRASSVSLIKMRRASPAWSGGLHLGTINLPGWVTFFLGLLSCAPQGVSASEASAWWRPEAPPGLDNLNYLRTFLHAPWRTESPLLKNQ